MAFNLDSVIPTVGASGAISGVLGAYIVLYPKNKISTIIPFGFIRIYKVDALYYIVIWFALQVILNFTDPYGGVAYMAHVGGFVGGAILIILLGGKKRKKSRRIPFIRGRITMIKLKDPIHGEDSFESLLYKRKSVRGFNSSKISLQQLSNLLFATYGIRNNGPYKTVPSAGALYPLSIYIAIGKDSLEENKSWRVQIHAHYKQS